MLSVVMNPGGDSSTSKGRGRGFCRPGHDKKELRRPLAEKSIGVDPKIGIEDLGVNSNNAESRPVAEGNMSKTKPLSVDAKEFYPANYQSQQLEDSEDSYSSSLQYEEGVPEEGDSCYYNSFNPTCDSKQEELATNHLIELMQHLTLNPGKFDDLVTPLVDTFSLWLGDTGTLSCIINAIVEQSIMEPNFRYNGAKLCHFLDSEILTEERIFRRSLLKRCSEEHTRISSYIYTDPGRLQGYVFFIAELFMQLECATGYGARISILGTALLEALSVLLTEPTSGNIKCVCQVLKLTGQPLDEQEPLNMNKVMECLLHLLNSMVLESNVQRLVSSVIELRHVGWGDTSNCMPHTSTSQLYNPCLNGPVFYGPDGQIMTPEESQFLQENAVQILDPEEYEDYGEDVDNVLAPDDEMDEEIQAAFEQFLQMDKIQSKDSNSSHNECNG